MLEVFPITVESHQNTSYWHIQIWEENVFSDNLHARLGKISSGRSPDIFFSFLVINIIYRVPYGTPSRSSWTQGPNCFSRGSVQEFLNNFSEVSDPCPPSAPAHDYIAGSYL